MTSSLLQLKLKPCHSQKSSLFIGSSTFFDLLNVFPKKVSISNSESPSSFVLLKTTSELSNFSPEKILLDVTATFTEFSILYFGF